MGLLVCQVVQGRDLHKMDMLGKADPFVELYTQPTAVQKTVRCCCSDALGVAALLGCVHLSDQPRRCMPLIGQGQPESLVFPRREQGWAFSRTCWLDGT